MNTDTLFGIGGLLMFGWLMKNYTRESVEAPSTSLPLKDVVDVRRWLHDGSQPTSERKGNRFPAVDWPEVTALS